MGNKTYRHIIYNSNGTEFRFCTFTMITLLIIMVICFVTGLCICFCTPCWMCNITSRMNESCLVGWCVPGGVVALRTKLRTMFGINVSTRQTQDWFNVGPAAQPLDQHLSGIGLTRVD